MEIMHLDLSQLFEDIEESLLSSIPRDIEALLRAPEFVDSAERDRRLLALVRILRARLIPPYIMVRGSRSVVDVMSVLWERGFDTSIARVQGFDPRSLRHVVVDMVEAYRSGLRMLLESRIRSYEIARRALRAAASICLAYGEACDVEVARSLGVDRVRKLLWF